MAQKPQCDCWKDPERAAERESFCDALGEATMHMFVMNMTSNNVCRDALAYAAASALAGIVVAVACGQYDEGREATDKEMIAALDRIVELALERINGQRSGDLDAMPTEGRA